MIDPDTRSAMYRLHLAGMPLREISRRFHIGRNTVRRIIKQQGAAAPPAVRRDKIQVDPELLEDLYRQCEGWGQRIHEILTEEKGVQISYQTLTRLLRELGLSSKSQNARCDRVPDEPGAEMQHDTTLYRIKLSGQATRLVASLLYLRYSKRRYLKFYRSFNRFAMKCFFHEALMHWGYSAWRCIIDNTNLARLRGSGKRAVIVPEMASFAKRYSFEFICHELKHSDRKAGEERSFWTVETNFLKGRTFENLADLNRQALQWATVRMEHRQVRRTGLIPAKAFEHEQNFLTRLPDHLPPPYQVHERGVDEYGYAAFQGNYYWAPGESRQDVKLLEYADHLKIYQLRKCVAEYPLPADGVKNERISPAGQPPPRRWPKHRKHGAQQEEQRLRSMGAEVPAYVDYVRQTPGIQRHRFVRELFALSRRVTEDVFRRTVERALRYRVVHIETLHRIAWLCMSQEDHPTPDVEVDESYRQRPAYQEGCLTDEPDLTIYDEPVGDDGDEEQKGNDSSARSENQDE